ncbi:CsbD family protein [Flavobacterium caseinilyticum]|uniref:General stress protein CsbD n=1 Tax=Flavobacterium caseinilyticum TaxID=2541732 RepID=A0A4R5AT25_9FLAO|nr:general stress protein CsbD [Flavobacterium caseinilyticum]TDD75475.1 general stress protein CsbD [Flavobacterium caseinilyticum]
MNTPQLDGNWEVQKTKLKEKFAALTDNDILFAQYKNKEMLKKLQIQLGKTKEELLKIFKEI